MSQIRIDPWYISTPTVHTKDNSIQVFCFKRHHPVHYCRSTPGMPCTTTGMPRCQDLGITAFLHSSSGHYRCSTLHSDIPASFHLHSTYSPPFQSLCHTADSLKILIPSSTSTDLAEVLGLFPQYDAILLARHNFPHCFSRYIFFNNQHQASLSPRTNTHEISILSTYCSLLSSQLPCPSQDTEVNQNLAGTIPPPPCILCYTP